MPHLQTFTQINRAVTVLLFHFWFGFGWFSQKTVVLVFPGFGFYMKYG